MSYVSSEEEVVVRIRRATEQLKADLRNAHAEIADLSEQVNMLKYSFKGLCGEQLHLAVNIHGQELLQREDAYQYLKFAIEHGAKRLAYEAADRFASVYKLQAELAQAKAASCARYPRARG